MRERLTAWLLLMVLLEGVLLLALFLVFSIFRLFTTF